MDQSKQERLEEKLDDLRSELRLEFYENENYDGYTIVESSSFTDAVGLVDWIMGQVNDIVKTAAEQ